MKHSEFKKIKDGRLERLRLHMFREDLTPKQKRALRKEIDRRIELGNKRQSNRFMKERINIGIYDAKTPMDLFLVASRWKNAMTPDQRVRVTQKANQLAQVAQAKAIRSGQGYTNILRDIRDAKRNSMRTKNMVKVPAWWGKGKAYPGPPRPLHNATNGIDVATFEKVPLEDARLIRQDLLGGKSPRFVYHKNTLARTMKNPITRERFDKEDILPLRDFILEKDIPLYKKLRNGKTMKQARG